MRNACIRLALVAIAGGLLVLLIGLAPARHPEMFGCQHHTEVAQ